MRYGLTCILRMHTELPLKEWCDILSKDIGVQVKPEDLHITFDNVGFQNTVTFQIVTNDYLAECKARDKELPI